MSRRRLVALSSALAILGIFFAVVVMFVAVTQTDFGRERVRRFLQGRVAAAMKGRGSMYIGRIGGSFLTGVTVDSFAIRDAEDSLFVSTGPLVVRYDPRDLIDKRVLVSYLRIERPVVNFRRHADGVWSFKRIFPSGPKKPRSTQRVFGDFIVVDSAELVDGRVIVTQPWSPADSLRGARRDSAEAAALASWRCGADFAADPRWLRDPCGKEVRRTSEGLKRTYTWRLHRAVLAHARIADPDTIGRYFRLTRLDVDEPDPPFAFRNVRGEAHWIGDTLWLKLPHFDLPGTTGSAAGRLRWGPGPMVYDIAITGDSVSLADVAWVYPTLPRDGGGRMKLRIRNDPRDLHILDYIITDADVRTTRSHLIGDITFGVGAPVLIVKDVAMRVEPVDFAFLETLAGAPFPQPWAGQITGTVRARGGRVTNFMVDEARFTFADANVRGAITRGTARGELDILRPALTRFHGFDVNLQTLDLRTIRYLFPNFARLGGTIAGRATLDSIWTDVRFRNADVVHSDGPGIPTRATGSGRVTTDDVVRFDVDLQLQPASLSMLARSYDIIPFRGPYSGPLRAVGAMDSLTIRTTLAGAGGTISYDGWVDADSVGGFAAYGVTTFQDANLRVLLDTAAAPVTSLNGRMSTALRFDSLANMQGPMVVELSRSRFDSARVFPSMAHLAFGGGRMRVDSLRLETTPALITARGAFGVDPAVSDTLHFTVTVDSLGGLRPYLSEPPTQRGATTLAEADSALAPTERDSLVAAMRDSLSGMVRVEGVLVGSVDTIAAAGTVTGSHLFAGGDEAKRLRGTFDLADVTGAAHGTTSVALDTLRVAGVRLASAGAELRLDDTGHGRFDARAVSVTGPRFAAGLDWRRSADTLEVRLDTLEAMVREHGWTLQRPVLVRLDSGGIAADTLIMRNGTGALTIAGSFPNSGPVSFHVKLDSLDLADVGAIAQSRTALDGWFTLDLVGRGTRVAPLMEAQAALDSVKIGTSFHVPRALIFANYADRNLKAGFALFREGRPVLSGSGDAPIDLSLVPVEERLLPDPIDARIEADSVDLALIEAMAPGYVRDVSGTLSTDVLVGGTWRRPTVAGRVRVGEGELGLPRLGIRLTDVTADIALSRDRIRIDTFAVASGERGGRASLSGAITLPTQSLSDYKRIGFDLQLRANHFQAIRQRRLAELEISGNLRLSGPFTGAHLTGDMTVDRGALYIQDAPQKQLVALDDPDFPMLIDTTDFENRRLLEAPSVVDTLVRYLEVDNVGLTLGDEVWLRSAAANVKLGGGVQVLKGGDRLALAGTLRADRGDYRLDLGLVQRRFDVTQGSISFFGEPGLDPALDITAVHTVRQVDRPDVRIRANIGGTLLQPRLTLSSEERIPLSTTEILSYLVFGMPSFALPQDARGALRPVAQALLPTAGVLLESQLRDLTGGFIDNISITPGGVDRQGQLSQTTFAEALTGSRIGVGKQIGERTFISANAGLCALSSGGAGTVSFAQTLGISAEVRLNQGWSLQTGLEPASAHVICNRAGTLYINTPPQFGFDLFREWSF